MTAFERRPVVRAAAAIAIARSLLILTTASVATVSNNHHGGAIFVSAFTTPLHGNSLLRYVPDARNVAEVSTATTSAAATAIRHYRYGGLSCRWATMPKDKEASTSTTSDTSSTSNSMPPPEKKMNASKLRQLKDRMWVRETLEDITAAEFASSLSVEEEDDNNNNNSGGDASSSNGSNGKYNNNGRRKRAVDFDNVLKKLDSRIEAMCIITTPESAQRLNQTCHIIDRRVFGSGSGSEEDDAEEEGRDNTYHYENACYSLDENVGMGSVVYTPQQREALLSRLISTRMRLVNFIEGNASEGSGGSSSEDEEESIDDIRSQLVLPTEDSTTSSSTAGLSSTSTATSFDPSLYVREDGTVDWDGALQDREALKKFGSAVWSRINGQDPEEANENANGDGNGVAGGSGGGMSHSPTKAVTAKIEETDAIREKREQLNTLISELQQMEVEHIKLLNSGEYVVLLLLLLEILRKLIAKYHHQLHYFS